MKKLFLMTFVLGLSYQLFASATTSVIEIVKSETTQQADNTGLKFVDDKFTLVLEKYLALKDALVGTDAANAKLRAKELSTALASFKPNTPAIKSAVKISNENDVEIQRRYFLQLNTQMISLLKANKIKTGAAYIAYCPMADNDNGGYWITNENAIRNPYFGNKMMKCGKIKETIK